MKRLILTAAAILFSSTAFSGLPEMMKIYNNPKSAPAVAACKGNVNCNAFTALAKQWKSIPDTYRHKQWDIKAMAKEGDGYGLNRGFSVSTEKSADYKHAGADAYYWAGTTTNESEAMLARGIAVLIYIEDKKGWTED